MLIIKNDYGFSAYCSNEYNGEKTHCYMPVTFKKGNEPTEEKVMINPTSFFMSCYTNKEGKVMPKMVVTEYVIVKGEKGPKAETKKVDIQPEDLPFY